MKFCGWGFRNIYKMDYYCDGAREIKHEKGRIHEAWRNQNAGARICSVKFLYGKSKYREIIV